VILPKRNEKDLVDIPDEVRNQLNLRLVDEIGGVLDYALEARGPGPETVREIL
jgi:ATP-dependent Lon protease